MCVESCDLCVWGLFGFVDVLCSGRIANVCCDDSLMWDVCCVCRYDVVRVCVPICDMRGVECVGIICVMLCGCE